MRGWKEREMNRGVGRQLKGGGVGGRERLVERERQRDELIITFSPFSS